MVLKYSKFKSMYDILLVAQSHPHRIKDFPLKDKSMLSLGSSEGQQNYKVLLHISLRPFFGVK